MQAEIKICSPPSCVIRGHQSYTLLTLSRLTQFHHHKVFFLLVKKTQEKVEIATQDILLLSAKVSQLMYQCLMGQIKKKICKNFARLADHLCVIRHKSVSLRRPISCVWNKKVIPFLDQGKDLAKMCFRNKGL